MALTPQGLPPSSQVRTPVAKAAEPRGCRVSRSYSAAVATSPKLWLLASNSVTSTGAPNASCARVADADLQLAGQVLDQLLAGDLEGAVRHLGHRVGEAGVGERAHVVEVEGVGRADLQVVLGPVGGVGEVGRAASSPSCWAARAISAAPSSMSSCQTDSG